MRLSRQAATARLHALGPYLDRPRPPWRSVAPATAAPMAMRSKTPTLTYYARSFGPNGYARPVAITLPFVSAIADVAHYAAPQPPPPSLPGERRGPAMTDRAIRKALGRDPEPPDPAFEAVMRRIEREGGQR